MMDTVFTPAKHGVHGRQRDEPWLSLEDDQQRTRRLIARLAYETYRSCMVGNPAPIVAQRWERMTHPQVGDLVVECSTVLYRAYLDDDRSIDGVYKGVGYLVKRSEEFIEWDEENWTPERPGYHEDYWYVQYGPAPEDVCRWENCDFIAIDLGKDFA